jgi:hypothetical protein
MTLTSSVDDAGLGHGNGDHVARRLQTKVKVTAQRTFVAPTVAFDDPTGMTLELTTDCNYTRDGNYGDNDYDCGWGSSGQDL